jgi:hypothetical protein
MSPQITQKRVRLPYNAVPFAALGKELPSYQTRFLLAPFEDSVPEQKRHVQPLYVCSLGQPLHSSSGCWQTEM